MSRIHASARGVTGLVLLALLVMPSTAGASAAPPEVKLERAPWSVHFGGTASIVGSVDGAARGAKVSLHRRWPAGGWYEHAIRRVGSNGNVRFKVPNLKRSARFKLVYSDPATGVKDSSRRVTVRVESRVDLKLRHKRVMEGGTIRVRAKVRPAGHRKATLQIRRNGTWRRVRRLDLHHGVGRARLKPNEVGKLGIRVVVAGDRYALRGAQRDHAVVFDPTLATWYGPGFYGNRTACGRTLTPSTLGVAHRSLPCGSKVKILYRGRWVTVPVIDRGPYSSAEFDLTERTADRLGFSGRQSIGVVRGR